MEASVMSLRALWIRSAACGALAIAFLSSGSLSKAQEPAAKPATDLPKGGVLPPRTPQALLLAPVVESPPAGETPKAAGGDNTGSAWLKTPDYRVMPRPGAFNPPPTGPGYYSMLDWLRKDLQPKAPPSGYPNFAIMPPSFFDANFRYVDDPNYTPDFLESLQIG